MSVVDFYKRSSPSTANVFQLMMCLYRLLQASKAHVDLDSLPELFQSNDRAGDRLILLMKQWTSNDARVSKSSVRCASLTFTRCYLQNVPGGKISKYDECAESDHRSKNQFFFRTVSHCKHALKICRRTNFKKKF